MSAVSAWNAVLCSNHPFPSHHLSTGIKVLNLTEFSQHEICSGALLVTCNSVTCHTVVSILQRENALPAPSLRTLLLVARNANESSEHTQSSMETKIWPNHSSLPGDVSDRSQQNPTMCTGLRKTYWSYKHYCWKPFWVFYLVST